MGKKKKKSNKANKKNKSIKNKIAVPISKKTSRSSSLPVIRRRKDKPKFRDWSELNEYRTNPTQIAEDILTGNIRVTKSSRATKKTPMDNRTLITQRRSAAVSLRQEGLSLTEIARVVRKTMPGHCGTGYSHEQVQQDLKHYLDTIHQSSVEEVKRMRVLELMRMDWLTVKLTELMTEDNKVSMTRLVELYLKVSSERSKLAGLHSPVQVDATLFGDLQIHFGIDDSQYKKVEADPDAYIEAEYEYVDPELEGSSSGEETALVTLEGQ